MANLEFRVYHKQEQRYGVRMDLDDHRIDYDFNGGMVDLAFAIKHPEWYVVEQFTGLQDSEGKDIYEGDIVKWNHNSKPGAIKWISESEGWDWTGWWATNTSYHGIDKSGVVVGNINETPELLNVEKNPTD